MKNLTISPSKAESFNIKIAKDGFSGLQRRFYHEAKLK